MSQQINKIGKSKVVVFASAFLMIVSISGCGLFSKKKAAAQKNPEVVSGEVVVQTSDKSTLKQLMSEYKVVSIDETQGVYSLLGTSLRGNEVKEAERISKMKGISFAEPNFVRQLNQLAPPRDPKWLGLWGLKNYGQDSANTVGGLNGADIQAQEAWKTTTGSKEIVVAVIDTGIDYTHPDLASNMWVNEKEKNGVPGVDDDGNGYTDDLYGWNFVSDLEEAPSYGKPGNPDPMDDQGHGTHCSGTIGAVGNNGIGVVGVNWNVRLMALKFLSASGGGNSRDLYRALQYAANQGVDVINASFGGGAPSKLELMALQNLTQKGVLFVAAAGNDGANINADQTPQFPAAYPIDGILAVAATDNRDQLASFSNYGSESVDLAAPGVAILSTFPTNAQLMKDEGIAEPYTAWSGTSMATPHVAGAAALVLAANPTLRKNPIELKKRLMQTTDYLPQLAGRVMSGGRLNLARAVQGGETTFTLRGNWKEEALSLKTPAYPTTKLDQVWAIQKKGVKALQLHLAYSNLDESLDLATLFDGSFRKISALPMFTQDIWLPAIQGDTAYLMFSNAMVSVQKYKGLEKVEDPEKISESEKGFCLQETVEGKVQWSCHLFHPPGKPFANFGSDSIVIDKIRYLEGEIQ